MLLPHVIKLQLAVSVSCSNHVVVIVWQGFVSSPVKKITIDNYGAVVAMCCTLASPVCCFSFVNVNRTCFMLNRNF